MSFAGQRGASNNVMIDGFDNNDQSLNGVRVVFSQEAIREFQVLTNSFSAEFGKAAGGAINVVSKSGRKEQLHHDLGCRRPSAQRVDTMSLPPTSSMQSGSRRGFNGD